MARAMVRLVPSARWSMRWVQDSVATPFHLKGRKLNLIEEDDAPHEIADAPLMEEKETEESKTKLEADLGQEEAKIMIGARHAPITEDVSAPSVTGVPAIEGDPSRGAEPTKTQKEIDRELKEVQQTAERARKAAEREASRQEAKEVDSN